MNILETNTEATANFISFTHSMLVVQLVDGRELRVPIDWFPRLKKATQEQRKNWRFIGQGCGIHWEDIDEDLSIQGLLLGKKSK